MERKNKKHLPSMLVGSTFIALIIWATTLTIAILTAMFSTITGKTTALFNTVFFEATETTTGTDVALGIESIPHALALFTIVWIVVFCLSFFIRSIWHRKHGGKSE